jgi:hypothetical protein
VTLHSHPFASWLVSDGTPLFLVSTWMGHSSQRVTEVYAYLVPEQREWWGGVFSLPMAGEDQSRAKESLRIAGHERTLADTRSNNVETTETQKTPSKRSEEGLRGAEHGTRTRDLNLGKVALYQLS